MYTTVKNNQFYATANERRRNRCLSK